MRKLEPRLRQYLLKETIISIFVNACINFVLAFLMFRSQDAIMFWGKGGLFLDLSATITFMTIGMALAFTPMHRGRVMKGTAPATPWHRKEHPAFRFLPDPFFYRALVFTFLALIILLPASTGLLVVLKDFPISFKWLLTFKTFYGGMVGLILTPIIILCALADRLEAAVQQAG